MNRSLPELDSEKVDRPINVAWLLTNRCNYDCGFCWRVLDHDDLTLQQALDVTDRLAKAGARKISWAGGEPLLWRGIDRLISHTKAHGIETMLITNGSRLRHVWPDGVPEYLDWLTLPLEGLGEDVNVRCGRDPGHFDRVVRLLEEASARTDLRLKINSVATRLNHRQLIDLVPLMKHYPIQRWKVFQFYPVRGYAKLNMEKFILPDSYFERLRSTLLRTAEEHGLDPAVLVIESTDELDRSYFTLAPDAHVYVSDQGEDRYLGCALTDDVQAIFDRSELDKDRYEDRSRWMLNQRVSIRR